MSSRKTLDANSTRNLLNDFLNNMLGKTGSDKADDELLPQAPLSGDVSNSSEPQRKRVPGGVQKKLSFAVVKKKPNPGVADTPSTAQSDDHAATTAKNHAATTENATSKPPISAAPIALKRKSSAAAAKERVPKTPRKRAVKSTSDEAESAPKKKRATTCAAPKKSATEKGSKHNAIDPLTKRNMRRSAFANMFKLGTEAERAAIAPTHQCETIKWSLKGVPTRCTAVSWTNNHLCGTHSKSHVKTAAKTLVPNPACCDAVMYMRNSASTASSIKAIPHPTTPWTLIIRVMDGAPRYVYNHKRDLVTAVLEDDSLEEKQLTLDDIQHLNAIGFDALVPFNWADLKNSDM
jgi:hypothetical protein